MNAFVKATKSVPVVSRTENNMKAFVSTLNANVDLFFKIGASRGQDVTALFERAYQEDSDLAVRIALWARDARGGAGERQLFRDILKHLEKFHLDVLTKTKVLSKIPELGRWDDLLIFENPEVKSMSYDIIHKALKSGNGLCAKWMPRKGVEANHLRNAFGWTPKFYRKRLVELTNVVETPMCAKKWDGIIFDHVPSLAMSRYMKAFYKNAPEAFKTYKTKLVKGEAKINAGAVYPYDIIKSLRAGGDLVVNDKQWEALPNFMTDQNVLPLVDVSGSMEMAQIGPSLTPLDVALSLGLYCADKNKGAFKDMFLTFSGTSELLTLKGTLSEKMVQMNNSNWGGNTNLHAAFKRILDLAIAGKVPQRDMPVAVMVMSDMQFDQCAVYDDSAIEMIARKYENAGYKIPGVIFWNLSARDNVPVKFNEKGCALISGFSPSIMKSVLSVNFDDMSPQSVMLKTLNTDRYDYK